MSLKRTFGSSLLISGTCIGAAMLALPVATAPLGLKNSLILLTVVWAVMCFTGLLIVEATLWLPSETNYISMLEGTLGRFGKIIGWLVFTILLYSLLSAYTTGFGNLITEFGMHYFHRALNPMQTFLPVIMAFAIIIYAGMSFSIMVNRILTFGLAISFASLATAVFPHIQFHPHQNGHFNSFLLALPIVSASFGFHIVIPSLKEYFYNKIRLLRWAVILGSLLPLIIYIIWNILIFGLIPIAGDHGLLSILHSGRATDLLTESLMAITQNRWITLAAEFFVFFAIASSFIGVAIGLFDLLADGLRIKRNTTGRFLLICLTFIPPLIFALDYPQGFITALSYAGVFVAILHGMLPVAVIWSGRYVLNLDVLAKKPYRVFGGRLALIIVFALACIVLYAQLATNLHWISLPSIG